MKRLRMQLWRTITFVMAMSTGLSCATSAHAAVLNHPYTHRRMVEAAVAAFSTIRDHDIDATPHQTLDNFTLTAYVLDERSTGKKPGSRGFGITASGTRAQVQRTVAVDPQVIPIGSYVYIEGIGWRVAEDTGGAVKGRHIDVLVPSEQVAIQFGVKRHVRVYVIPRTDDR
jgi:3D (Asp-Asp-Asp) domain-containing protein